MSTLLLIDLSSAYWAAWHSSVNDEVSAARDRTLSQIRRIVADSEADHVAICCDIPGRTFRHEIYPDYKANRPAKDQSALDELRLTKERLCADGHLLWEATGFEADDVIATACAEAQRRNMRVIVATADKDLMQLVTDDVHVFSTKTGIVLDPPAVQEKFGIPPRQLREWLALVGDNSDNVPGVDKVGAKTAATLLARYGSATEIYKVAKSGDAIVDCMTASVRASICANFASLDVSLALVTLRTDAPINFDEIFEKREAAQLPVREYGDDVTEAELVDEEDHGDPAPADAQSETPLPPPPSPPSSADQPEKAKVAEVVALVPVSFERELEPRNYKEAWVQAVKAYQSRSYVKFANPETIWSVILRGREMGLGAMTSLDCFHVIEGRPSLYAWLVIARAKAHPDCEYFQCVETSDVAATWETKNRRNPTPTRLSVTIAQAERQGLVAKTSGGKPNNWMKSPDDMLRKFGGVKLARMEYPDAALGLYAAEELGYDGE